MMTNPISSRRDVNQNPLYLMRSRRKLAKLLRVSQDKLQDLSSSTDLYRTWSEQKQNGKLRHLAAPRADLKAVQSRLAALLSRIAPPDFLFSPVKGRSYVDHAARHVGARAVRLIDVEDYFPNCTTNRVKWFFKTVLKCSPDVSAVLCRIVTRAGALPQGSPSSPILAYLSYQDMWLEIAKEAEAHNCVLGVYADDIAISGSMVPEILVWTVKRLLKKHGHRHNASKLVRHIDKPTRITGVIVDSRGLRLPNRQHKRLAELRREIAIAGQAATVEQRRSLAGRIAQARQVLDPQSL